MDAPAKDTAGSAHLDMLRGVAALTVFLGHIRALLFVDYQDVAHKGVATRAIYAVLGLGHQAVIVFFVLSGFLVGGSVIRKIGEGRFSVRQYSSARLSRLYAALLPALVFGVALDLVGSRYIGTRSYVGGFADTVPQAFSTSISFPVLAGNLCFLQTLWVPILGTNAPLWSLPCEFWYYVAFPCLMAALSPRLRPSLRLGCALALAIILAILARAVVPLFGVWLFGAAVSAMPRGRIHWGHQAISLVALAASLAFGRASHSTLVSDYILGVASALAVYTLAMSSSRHVYVPYRTAGSLLSGISYTLYLGHFPALVFLSALLLHGAKIQPDKHGVLIGGAALAAIMAYAWFLWCIGERHTSQLRKVLEHWLAKRAKPVPCQYAIVNAAADPEQLSAVASADPE